MEFTEEKEEEASPRRSGKKTDLDSSSSAQQQQRENDASEEEEKKKKRLADLGFGAADAERALKAAHGDAEAASNLLLNANTGNYYNASPHDVLVEAAEPYARTRKGGSARPQEDPKKRSNFTADLPGGSLEGVPPAAVLDARLSQFMAMGFDAANAEAALDTHAGDINAALTSLLDDAVSREAGRV